MSTHGGKQIPHPSELDLEFFEAAVRTGQLHVQHCTRCGDAHHPPRLYCPECFSAQYTFTPVSGRGTVYSHTVSRYTTERAWKDQAPYATAVVELEEGPRVVGSVRGVRLEDLRIGLGVRVTVEAVDDDFAYVWVDPAEGDEEESPSITERGGSA